MMEIVAEDEIVRLLIFVARQKFANEISVIVRSYGDIKGKTTFAFDTCNTTIC